MGADGDDDGDGGIVAPAVVIPVVLAWIGLPTLLVAGLGLASTAVWFALFGGGDDPARFGSTHRSERRWER